MKPNLSYKPIRSSCPIASTLDLIGDRWTLLVIRDIGLFDKHRNKDFQNAGENFPTNILADRLKKLRDNHLIEKVPYQTNPPRFEYHLTTAGRELIPILQSMALWGERHISGTKIPKELR